MAFPKHKRTYGAKKGTKKMHCRAHKDKKKWPKVLSAKKSALALYLWEKKKKVKMIFYK